MYFKTGFCIFWGIGLVWVVSGFTPGLSHNKIFRPNAAINVISGQVWDPNRRPAANLYVELQTELGSNLGRQRTTETGFFSFSGVSSGRFKIHVITLGTDYLDQTQDVQIMNLQQGMSDTVYVDFYLKYDPRRVKSGLDGVTDEVFAQEGISKEAEKHYKKGMSLLEDSKTEQAVAAFRQALDVTPNYYYALNALGRELVQEKKYSEALEYLIKAIDLNQRSYSSYYYLGYACYQLNAIPEAIQASKAATVLKQDSLYAQLLYGTVLRIAGNYDLSERSLLKAKKIGNNKIAGVNWQLALVFNRLNRNKEAADELETYLINFPTAENKKDVQELIAKLRTSTSVDIR